MGNKPKVVVKPDEDLPVEILVQEIEKISKAMQALQKSRCTRSMIITLIHDSSRVSKKTIAVVLNHLEELEKIWLKPKNKP